MLRSLPGCKDPYEKASMRPDLSSLKDSLERVTIRAAIWGASRVSIAFGAGGGGGISYYGMYTRL